MADTETTPELAPTRAAELIRDGAKLIDVRQEEEHEAAHIEGDELVPFDQLKHRAASFDQSRPVVLYCRSGDRSGAAVQALRASGYDAYSIEGGILGWTENGLPIEGHVVDRDVLPPA
jgi:rhodanese-related sulfurtransferase